MKVRTELGFDDDWQYQVITEINPDGTVGVNEVVMKWWRLGFSAWPKELNRVLG